MTRKTDQRTTCSIPGCQRTTGEPFDGWICGPHWVRLTRAERRVWARLKRKARRFGWEALTARIDRIWWALIRRATPEEGIPHGNPPRHHSDHFTDERVIRTRAGRPPVTRERRPQGPVVKANHGKRP